MQVIEVRPYSDWKPQRTSTGWNRRRNLTMGQLVDLIRREEHNDVNHEDSSRSLSARERTRNRRDSREFKRQVREVFA